MVKLRAPFPPSYWPCSAALFSANSCFWKRGWNARSAHCSYATGQSRTRGGGRSGGQHLHPLEFITLLVLFSVNGMGIFGSMQEGITGNPTIPDAKAILDLFTCADFCCRTRLSGRTDCDPATGDSSLALFRRNIAQRCYPGNARRFLEKLRRDHHARDRTTHLPGSNSSRSWNMLPALFLVMPISALWHHLPL